mgnify:CR=1 FL=1
MAIIHEYLRMKGQETYNERMKSQANRDVVNKKLDKSMTTRSTGIPDMRLAYNQVKNSGHKPTPEEIHFRRFTSGSYHDSE